MPGTFATTANFALRRLLGTSKGSDIDEGFQRLAEDVDQKMVGYVADTFAKRPPAGIPNRLFRATDGEKALYVDNGTTWDRLTHKSGEPYGALTTRTTGAEIEPSSTEPTEVAWQAQVVGETGKSVKVYVGGVLIHELINVTSNEVLCGSFRVEAGVKYKIESNTGATVVKTSHLPI